MIISKIAALPLDSAPVTRKWTRVGPTWIVSSAGLGRTRASCWFIASPFVNYAYSATTIVYRGYYHVKLSAGVLLIGALLRVAARAVQRRIIAGLNAAGFDDLRVPHLA